MSIMLRYFLMIAILGYFWLIIHLLRREKFLLRYGILWLISGLIMLVLCMFPNLLINFTQHLGVEIASNGLFAICIFLVIMMLVFLTAVMTELTSRIKKMAQKTAMIEKRLRDLEEIGKMQQTNGYCQQVTIRKGNYNDDF